MVSGVTPAIQLAPGGTRIWFGDAALGEVRLALSLPHLPGTIAIVGSRGSLHRDGVGDRLAQSLQPARVVRHDGVEENPTPESCQMLARALARSDVQAIVALGGGSVIDAAKVARCALATGREVRDLIASYPPTQQLASTIPLVAIPTTAGTGAEVTHFATIWDRKENVKLSLEVPGLEPDAALIVPMLMRSMPPGLTVTTGLDALGHALESCWSRAANPISESIALGACRMVTRSLPRVVTHPDDLEARANQAWGSLLGGMAIKLTRTSAAHALSYALTLSHGVPHGLAVAYFLPGVLRANFPSLESPVRAAIRDCFGAKSDGELPERVRTFVQSLGARPPATWGLTPANAEALLMASAVQTRLSNNVRPLGADELRVIIAEALDWPA